MNRSTEQIVLTLEDVKVLERIAVTEAKLEILVNDFQSNKIMTDSNLKDISDNISKIYDLTRAFPEQIKECRQELEADIEDLYMLKKDSELLEQHLINNVKSIKLWIVTSVGGFTSAGLFILWVFNVFDVTIS